MDKRTNKDYRKIAETMEIMESDLKDKLLKKFNSDLDLGKKYSNLIKWLRYDVSQKKDADIIIKINNIDRELNWYSEDTKNRYLDCIFSMNTHLNMFLRMYCPRAAKSHEWLLVNFDLVFSDKEIQCFCDKIKKYDSGESMKQFMKCMDEVDIFARNTHTIGNYMPCPDNEYNRIKGFIGKWVFNDRIELLLEELDNPGDNSKAKGKVVEWKCWFKKNAERLKLEELCTRTNTRKKLSLFPLHIKATFEPDDISRFANYLEIVNDWIERRTSNLIEQIKNYKNLDTSIVSE